jgi:hypothetical protein
MGDFFSANRLSFPNFVSELSLNPETIPPSSVCAAEFRKKAEN